ncbi:hypothetical protein EMPS_01245 [Entomortierella parvispora]|uniref:Uncharacterized protein n=1 Tax=Entomortierella parvispora TaxID=205924 RepID=A0A9P3H2M3_9FUNG|nr:hypothetical protein EMPS_01245 [Entomortierella parvispora]
MDANNNSLNLNDLDFSDRNDPNDPNDPSDFYTLLTGLTQQDPPLSPDNSIKNPVNPSTPSEFDIFDLDAAQDSPSSSTKGTALAILETTQSPSLDVISTSSNDPAVVVVGMQDVPLSNNIVPSSPNISLRSELASFEATLPNVFIDQSPNSVDLTAGLLSDVPSQAGCSTDKSSSQLVAALPSAASPMSSVNSRPSPHLHSVAAGSDLQEGVFDYFDQATLYQQAQVNLPEDLIDSSNSHRAFTDPNCFQVQMPTGSSSGVYPHYHHQQPPPLQYLQHPQYLPHQYSHYQYPQYPPHQYAHPPYTHYPFPQIEYSRHSQHLCPSYHRPHCNSPYQHQLWTGHPSLETSLPPMAQLPSPYSAQSIQARPVAIPGMRQHPQDPLLHNGASPRRQLQRHRSAAEVIPLANRASSRKRSVSESRKPILQKVKHFLRSSTRLGMDGEQSQRDSHSRPSSSAPLYMSPGYSTSAPNLSPYSASAPFTSTLSSESINPATIADSDQGDSSQSSKKITDSAHFRSRNAFFIFRGFISRLQTLAAAANPDLNPSQAQTKVSMSCGKLWGHSCNGPCSLADTDCVNCRTRSLFLESASNLKHRQEVIQRQLKFPSSLSSSSDSLAHHGETEDGVGSEATVPRRVTPIRIEDSFDWEEFQELYPQTDLFRWYREKSLTGDMALDVEEMRRIWIENETNYEKAFIEGAKKRIAQEMERRQAKHQ